ncbi:22859_t:CDS:2 [Cetraspora pellucida]|uniref:22859_t:CDS:1 n=1 Tax=Cetraspora pellucida TaxID=1433469 RepID=A0A9N9E8L8_9GLOM|nr:22859_t:CDS:2 [Cetraspora pellucida]
MKEDLLELETASKTSQLNKTTRKQKSVKLDDKGTMGEVLDNIRCYWLVQIAKQNNKSDDNNSDNKSIISSSSVRSKASTSYFKPISNERVNEINKALLKAFVCTGIAFFVIDNLFVCDLLNILEPGYILPERLTLAERVLNKKAASVDGWSSPTNNSLYNFIVSISDRKEYLYSILDFSDVAQTGKFLTFKISDIVDKIGFDKFIACITDNRSNIHVILENNCDLIYKPAIILLLNDNNDMFYTNCCQIASIIQPIKEAIHSLEARIANLANCFINIVKLAAAINRISKNNELSENKLHDNTLDLTTYTVTENNNIVLEQNIEFLEPLQLNNKFEISSITDLLNITFGGKGNSEKVFHSIVENSNIEFDPTTVVKSEFQNVDESL